MHHVVLSCVVVAFAASASLAQQRGPVVSPQIGASGAVTFRVLAPEAKEVNVNGQWPDGKLAMTKNDDGVWETVAVSVPPGVWEYSFNIDGVTMIDPGNPAIKPMRSPRTSILHIASDPPALVDYQDVPHGTVHTHDYQSVAAGDVRQFVVYTPPGYENATESYPLLCLQHGSGDTQAAWVVHGKANWVLDNLIAQGKAKPMIVLMMNGHVAPPGDRGQNTALFEKDLLEQVMPMVTSLYRVADGAQNRAIVGLSMGGAQSSTIGLNHTDTFAWIGVFSGVPSTEAVTAALDHAEQTNANLRLLWIACGKDDGLLERNVTFVNALKERGIEHEWYETAGGHSWPVWRGYLGELLPRLFQPGDTHQ